MKVNKHNYTGLVHYAGKLLKHIYTTYPITHAKLFTNLGLKDVMATFLKAKEDTALESDTLARLVAMHKTKDNEDNRTIIYALTDSVFLTMVWFNLYLSKTGQPLDYNNEIRTLGKAAAIILNEYNTHQQSRILNNGIRASYLSYEPIVVKSLADKHTKESTIDNSFRGLATTVLENLFKIESLYERSS